MKQTLKKHERLHGKITIDCLFSQGKSIFSFPFVVFYQVVSTTVYSPLCTVLFSVSKKKISHATQRNLVKRRMREVFRKNKHLLYSKISALQSNSLHLAFVYISNEILTYSQIEKKMMEAVSVLFFKADNTDNTEWH